MSMCDQLECDETNARLSDEVLWQVHVLFEWSVVVGEFADEVRSESFISTSCLHEFMDFSNAVPLAIELSGHILSTAEISMEDMLTRYVTKNLLLSIPSRH